MAIDSHKTFCFCLKRGFIHQKSSQGRTLFLISFKHLLPMFAWRFGNPQDFQNPKKLRIFGRNLQLLQGSWRLLNATTWLWSTGIRSYVRQVGLFHGGDRGGVGWTQVPSGGSEFWLICIQLWYLVVSVCNFCCVDHWWSDMLSFVLPCIFNCYSVALPPISSDWLGKFRMELKVEKTYSSFMLSFCRGISTFHMSIKNPSARDVEAITDCFT